MRNDELLELVPIVTGLVSPIHHSSFIISSFPHQTRICYDERRLSREGRVGKLTPEQTERMHSRLEMDAPTSAPPMTSAEIFALVQSDLALVEAEFKHAVYDAPEVVAAMGCYLHEGGGKRVRPALLLLAAHMAGGAAGEAAAREGAVLAMEHTAGL